MKVVSPPGPSGNSRRVQHRRDRRPLGIRVVRVEGLEEAGSQAVAAEVEVAELRAQLVGQDEPGVDDLAILAVTQERPVAGSADRNLDRPDHRSEHAALVLGERRGKTDANDRVRPERALQRVRGRRIGEINLWIEPDDFNCAEVAGQRAHRDG